MRAAPTAHWVRGPKKDWPTWPVLLSCQDEAPHASLGSPWHPWVSSLPTGRPQAEVILPEEPRSNMALPSRLQHRLASQVLVVSPSFQVH